MSSFRSPPEDLSPTASYRQRYGDSPSTVRVIVWTGDNIDAVQTFLGENYHAENVANWPNKLSIRGSSLTRLMIVDKGAVVFVGSEGRNLGTLSRAGFHHEYVKVEVES